MTSPEAPSQKKRWFRPKRHQKNALEHLEDAMGLLRKAPAGSWLLYLTGALPLAASLLISWSVLSTGAGAHRDVTEWALGVAVAFIWYLTWQSLFAESLAQQLQDDGTTKAAARSDGPLRVKVRALVLRIWGQTVVQGFTVPLLAASPFLTIFCLCPFHFSQLFLFRSRESEFRPGTAVKETARLAFNHTLSLGLCIIGLLFLIVLANIIVLFLIGPLLLKRFLGWETTLSMGMPWAHVSIHLLLAFLTAGLLIDPLIKAFYAVFLHEQESLKSGRDLRSSARRLMPRRSLPATVAVLLALTLPLNATPPAAPPATEAATLRFDHAVDNVLQRPEYNWRLAREHLDQPDGKRSPFLTALSRQIDRLKAAMNALLKKVLDPLRRLLKKWLLSQGPTLKETNKNEIEWNALIKWLAAATLGLVVAGVLFRLRRRRAGQRGMANAASAPMVVDLEAEHIAANHLPHEQWMALARELMASGELRLATRALYLAGLAQLGERGIVTFARAKTNGEFVREVARRSRQRPALLPLFRQSVLEFEQVWYGEYSITLQTIKTYEAGIERLFQT